jgi:hypothetical protein
MTNLMARAQPCYGNSCRKRKPTNGLSDTWITSFLIPTTHFTRKARPKVLGSANHHGLQLFISQIKALEIKRLVGLQGLNSWWCTPCEIR